MYAEVRISPTHAIKTLRIPGTALIIDANGNRVAIVDADRKVHLQPVVIGRDFGSEVEILSGLESNDKLANNPPDTLADGDKVQVVKASHIAPAKARKKSEE